MKKLFAVQALIPILVASCSSNTVEVQEQSSYVQPKWYAECKSIDTETENFIKFWESSTYYYSCGTGTSGFESAANIKALQIAKRNLADRLNGKLSSASKITMADTGDAENLESQTTSEITIYNKISDISLTHYAQTDHYSYKRDGLFYSFVMIKLSKDNVNLIVDKLNNETN